MSRNFGNFVENCIFARTMFERIRYNETEREREKKEQETKREEEGRRGERERLYTRTVKPVRAQALASTRVRARLLPH